jgi:hypothetical protein
VGADTQNKHPLIKSKERRVLKMQQFNRKLTDKGWASMQGMLDRDMPVNAGKKRRIAWWWFFGGASFLFLAGTGAMHIIQQINQQDLNRKHVEPMVIRSTNAPVAANPETSAQMNAAPMAAVSRVPENRDLPVSTDKKNSQALPAAITTELNARYVSKETGLSAVSVAPVLEKSAPAPVNSSLSELNVPIQPVGCLACNSAEWPDIQPVQPGSVIKKVSKSHGPRKFRFGIYSGISAEKLVAINGLAAGFTATWQPYKHWGLRMGLGYSVERPTLRSRPVADISAQHYLNYINSGYISPGTISSDPYAKVLIPVRYLHQIEMPLLLYWQPTAQWRFYAGGKFQRTFFANSDKFSYVSGKASTPSSVLAENRSLNQLATRELSFWKGYGNFGAAFMPNKHWEFALFSQLHWDKQRRAENDGSFADQLKSQAASNRYNLRFQLSTTLFF